MKVALLINRDNFEKYSKWDGHVWELLHYGNGEPDPIKIAASGAEALVVDAVMRIGPEIIEKTPSLKLVHSQGVAYNAIDTDAARKAGIFVCNCAGVNARSVAEQSILLMLALLKNFRQNEDMVYTGKQMDAKVACFRNGLPELYEQKVGIIGLGAIGKALCEMLKAFGCEIFYHTRSGDINMDGATYLPIEELYASCDIISLNVPVTPETTNMINANSLKAFKRGALLINAARGELMDHAAVVEALASGQLGGLGADTLAPEPFLLNNPVLRDLPNELRQKVALSPHIAGITGGTFTRVYERIRKNIDLIEKGMRPDCIVNGL